MSCLPLGSRCIGVVIGVSVVATLAGCTPAAPAGGVPPPGGGGGRGGGGRGGQQASGGGMSGSGGSQISGTGGGMSGSGGSGAGGAAGSGSNVSGTGGSAGSTLTRDASTDVDIAIADAGPGDAARDVAAESGGQPPAGCAGLFCEDFESGGIDPGVWDVKTSGGQTVVVQKTRVAHGTYAAQFHAQPNILSYDLIMTKNAPAALRGHHFGRAYFYVTPQPPSAHTLFLLAGSAGFPKLRYLEVAGINNTWQLTSVNLAGIDANGASVAGTTEAYSSGGRIPLAQWICLEWELNDAPDQIRVFVNGTQDFAFTNILLNNVSTGQVGGNGFTDFGFGYYAWHPATYAFDIYYDDIVLDSNRVGCLP